MMDMNWGRMARMNGCNMRDCVQFRVNTVYGSYFFSCLFLLLLIMVIVFSWAQQTNKNTHLHPKGEIKNGRQMGKKTSGGEGNHGLAGRCISKKRDRIENERE